MKLDDLAAGGLDRLAFDNHFAALPAQFHTRLAPSGLPQPKMVAISDGAAALLGLARADLETDQAAQIFSGNRVPVGGDPLAAVYSGHQFGVWAGQLGDGRAHLLGSVQHQGRSFELQLKGAGPTPYSRMGDGRAVLRSSIREFLCSEAMAGLGIPTTRALCLVESALPVRRETVETAAVVTRMAPSFVRFGSFEHWSANGDVASLTQLADYVIDRFMPQASSGPARYADWLREVARRTAVMMAGWQSVGFMHGVMNTDNFSILGLTLDYGPFGFMESFDGGHICNHTDSQGRYAFNRQPQVAYWNLHALGHALLPLIGDEQTMRAAIDDGFVTSYNDGFAGRLRAKLGLGASSDAADLELFEGLFSVFQKDGPDYTSFFRALADLRTMPAGLESDASVRDLFLDREAIDAWLVRWRQQLAADGRADEERRAAMNAVNPRYVLRNWMAEQAIRSAREGDFGELRQLQQCLSAPFDEVDAFERYAQLPPDWARGLEVSCSS
ncbi:YdiU family protein [soil metagenome]